MDGYDKCYRITCGAGMSAKAVLTTEEPSDLEINVIIYIGFNGRFELLNDDADNTFIQYKNLLANNNDTIELGPLETEFINLVQRWNDEVVENVRIRKEQIRIAEENERARKVIENTQYTNKYFPLVNVPASGWKILNIEHNRVFLEKEDVIFRIYFINGVQKWNLDITGNYCEVNYNIKSSKDIKNIFKYILQNNYSDKFLKSKRNKEESRKQKVLLEVMEKAGWSYTSNGFFKSKESGRYWAQAEISKTSDQVYITSIIREVKNLNIIPDIQDCCIFE